nr:ABC transporter substrate-binding protein [Mesorhizobium sp. WSM4875]
MNNRIHLPVLTEVSRRRFLGGAATAMGAAALSISPFGSTGRAAGPKRGGVFRAAIPTGSASDVLDPARYLAPPQYLMGMTLGNALVELTGDKKPIPELAESWEHSDDLKRWVFHIRKGVQFHNGKTLDSADVVYSLSRHIGKDSSSAGSGMMKGVLEIVADGPDAVVITHETGTPDLHYALANFQFVIVPKDFSDWNNFVGTGPYTLKTFNPGVLFEATRNPNYWKPNAAWFDEVNYLFISDLNAALHSLLSGEVHAVQEISSRSAKKLQSNGDVTIVRNDGTMCTQLDMDTRYKELANPKVRNAMKYLIDRQKMVDFITDGYSLVGNDQPIPPNDPFFNPEVKPREYDPERAKHLLKEAGVSSLGLDLHVADVFANAVDATAIIQQTAAAGGVDVKIRRAQVDGYWSDIWMKRPFIVSEAGVRATPDVMFSLFFACQAGWNETFWCNDRFNKLLAAGRSTADFDKRKTIYGEMQQLVSDDGGIALFMYRTILDLYSKSIGGTAPDATRPMMGMRVAERAWFET